MITSGRLKTIESEVEELLVKYPDTRSSDEVLYGTYLCGKIQFCNVLEFFKNFSKISEEKNIASLSTISRLRRKVQEHRPDLQATKETQEARDEIQGSFFDWARGIQ